MDAVDDDRAMHVQGGDQMNHDNPMQTREAMSALADGQLRGDAFATALAAATHDSAAEEAWHCYHLIGDALRSPDMARGRQHDAAFLARLRTRLADEPVPAAAEVGTVLIANNADTALGAVPFDTEKEAANDQVWRWKMVAGLASMAAVGVLAWSAGSSLWNTAPQAAVLAQWPAATGGGAAAQAPILVASPNGAVLRDPRLDDMLAAHRQLGGSNALQMPAGFLRNATFEGAAR